MGNRKGKGKQPTLEPDDDDFMGGLSGILGDFHGYNYVETIAEEDEEDEEDDEDDEDQYTRHPAQKGKGGNNGNQQQYQKGKGQHQQYQKGGQQQQQYQKGGQQQQQKGGGKGKGNNGNQNQMGGQKNQQNQKGQKSQKGQKEQQQQHHQQETGWGSLTGGGGGSEAPGWGASNDWGANEGGGGNDWGANSGPGWGDGGGGGESEGWGAHQARQTAAGSSTHPLHQQRLLASLLNQPWTPAGTERGRGNNHNQYGQGRAPTAAESVKAAANGRNPSRTLLYAATGSAASVLDGGARGGPHTTVQIHDSGGAALEEADRALYSRERPVNQRIHWMFSPTKDDRVASLMDWIQAMSHGLATLGLHKFIHTQQRGALIANADFRPWKAPNEPAFDWVTFDDVVETHDRTLQESMAFYDPESQVLVFVFLLSRSGNSLAMWRRKLAVPNVIRKQNRAEISRIIKTLAERKYLITVDELPPPPAKPKKKWFNVRW